MDDVTDDAHSPQALRVISKTPCAQFQAQSQVARSQYRSGEDCPLCRSPPNQRIGLGDAKRRASTTSDGLVIQSAATCVVTAMTKTIPIIAMHAYVRVVPAVPGKNPPASKG